MSSSTNYHLLIPLSVPSSGIPHQQDPKEREIPPMSGIQRAELIPTVILPSRCSVKLAGMALAEAFVDSIDGFELHGEYVPFFAKERQRLFPAGDQ